MKIRYCQTKLYTYCPVAWGSAGTEGLKSCYVEPMEENCKHIIETDDEHEIEFCPTCGRRL